ncbi:MAG: hypothetical protein H0Z33_15465 [Bacillaceae bacterium]|nr:hypothetical protein [Bacillaceae bacterium]
MKKKLMAFALILGFILFFSYFIKKERPIPTNSLVVIDFSSMTFIKPLEEQHPVNTVHFKGFIYGMGINKERQSIILRYHLPHLGYLFFDSRKFFWMVEQKHIKITGKDFQPGNLFYTYKQYLVVTGKNEVGVFDLNKREFVKRIPVTGNEMSIDGSGHEVYVSYNEADTRSGNLLRINLETLDSDLLLPDRSIAPDKIFVDESDENVYGIFLSRTDHLSKMSRNSFKLGRLDLSTNQFMYKTQIEGEPHDFVIYGEKAYIIGERDVLWIADMKNGQVEEN